MEPSNQDLFAPSHHAVLMAFCGTMAAALGGFVLLVGLPKDFPIWLNGWAFLFLDAIAG